MKNDVKIINGDCREVLKTILDSSIHMILTDPPYFLDGLDNEWRKGDSKNKTGAIKGLPVGMKFDSKQGKELQSFIYSVSEELHRVLKPGGFLLMFSSPRLYHRMAVAVEDAGFEIRDMFAWHFTKKAQFKAFTLDHFVKRRKDLNNKEKDEAIEKLMKRRTPQLRPQFESILCAQKPKEGTFVDNWLEHETGLINAKETLDGFVPSTVMKVEKDGKKEYNMHLTPKPLRICDHLIRLFSKEGQMILDPFVGSGTTCLAALQAERDSIGIDINSDYVEIANKRIQDYYDSCINLETADGIFEMLKLMENWKRPKFPLNGNDILDLGIPEGKNLGILLKSIEREWIDSDFKLSREYLLNRAKEIIEYNLLNF